jgi:hypothetical protein
MMNDVLVELIFGGGVLTGDQPEILRRRKGEKRPEPAAARAVAGHDLAELHRDVVTDLAALAAAGVGLFHCILPG